MLHTHQHTLARTIRCTGRGLHSGKDVQLALVPAPVDSGIRFRRVDITGKPFIAASYDKVNDTRFCTTIAEDGIAIATIEHLMAALAGLGVDNLVVELDGSEVPVMDGSAEPFVFLLECAGIVAQDAPRHYWKVLQPMQLHVNGSWVEIEPAESFTLDVTIDFANPAIGRQQMAVDFAKAQFKNTLSRARTFGFEQDVAKLREAGLALGGSLDNAIVVNENRVLNRDGLRYANEFVRHKMLDCLGDLYLAGHQILGHVRGYRIGHAINNLLLRTMLEGDGVAERVTLTEKPQMQEEAPAFHHTMIPPHITSAAPLAI